MLAAALRAFHSASAKDRLFEAYVPGESREHGDVWLNIIVAHDGPMDISTWATWESAMPDRRPRRSRGPPRPRTGESTDSPCGPFERGFPR